MWFLPFAACCILGFSLEDTLQYLARRTNGPYERRDHSQHPGSFRALYVSQLCLGVRFFFFLTSSPCSFYRDTFNPYCTYHRALSLSLSVFLVPTQISYYTTGRFGLITCALMSFITLTTGMCLFTIVTPAFYWFGGPTVFFIIYLACHCENYTGRAPGSNTRVERASHGASCE